MAHNEKMKKIILDGFLALIDIFTKNRGYELANVTPAVFGKRAYRINDGILFVDYVFKNDDFKQFMYRFVYWKNLEDFHASPWYLSTKQNEGSFDLYSTKIRHFVDAKVFGLFGWKRIFGRNEKTIRDIFKKNQSECLFAAKLLAPLIEHHKLKVVDLFHARDKYADFILELPNNELLSVSFKIDDGVYDELFLTVCRTPGGHDYRYPRDLINLSSTASIWFAYETIDRLIKSRLKANPLVD